MAKHTDKKERLAVLTSNILNPFLIGMALILLFSFSSTATTSEAFKWAGISMAVGIVPVFLVVLYFYKNGQLDNFFISVRAQRTRIYIFGIILFSISCVLLSYMGAPVLLVAGFVSGLSAILIFAFINLRWKISVHTGFMAGSSLALVMLFGWMAAASVVLVPLTAWARIKLESHSLAQTVGGAVMASLIVAAVFYPLAIA